MTAKDLEDLRLFHTRVVQSRTPEDLFGELTGDKAERLAGLKKAFMKLVSRYHPDKAGPNPKAQHYSHEIMATVNTRRDEAMTRIEAGIYGVHAEPTPKPSTDHVFETRKHVYRVSSFLASGDVADVWKGEYDEDDGTTQEIVVKIAREKSDSRFMQKEREALQILKHKSMPVLVEGFKTTDGKAASVLRYADGTDLKTLREKHPDGVPERHLSWIFLRLLSVVGYVHSQGTIHGNIEPGNVIVRGRDHNVFLIDYVFSASPKKGDSFVYANDDYSAPEVSEKRPPIPPSDLWSVVKCMIFLAGGAPDADEAPDSLDPKLRHFMNSFLDPNPLRRARDAWSKWHELTKIRESIFGPRKFVPFDA